MTTDKKAAPVNTGRPHTSTSFSRDYRTPANIEADFRDALRAAGLPTAAEIPADSKLHRVHIEGDRPGSKNGWAVLHADGIACGVFGSWKHGISGTPWRADIGRRLTPAETREHRQRIEAARRLRDTEQARIHAECRAKAARLLERATPARSDNPYLIRKNVPPFNIRQLGDSLVVPVYDTTGTLHGLQFIGADGVKKYLFGTAKTGCCNLLGSPGLTAGAVLAIAEGYATAATIHAATDWPVACCFDCGNLEPVARALAKAYPTARIIVCADNDHGTPGNPGLKKACDAARAVGGTVAAPAFRSGDSGDWNDYSQRYGMAATATALLSVLRGVSHVA